MDFNPCPKPPAKQPKQRKPIQRTRVCTRRAKARPGRLRDKAMQILREAAWERDRGVCQRCFLQVGSEAWQLSHRRGKRMWGDHLENVQVEHDACHKQFHAYGPTGEKPCPKKIA